MGYGRLTEKKVRYIVRHKRRGKSNREIALMRVSNSQEGMVLLAHTWRVFANKKEGEKGEGAKRKGEGNNK